ncbi:MAG: glycoside hydrolase family 127 protein, partial [Planctomycetota bacterium]
PPAHPFRQGQKPPVRQAWFGCACCPPNVARLLASLGEYVYTTGQNQVAVHLYTASRATIDVNGVEVALEQSTDYPFDERVGLAVSPSAEVHFALCLRLPGWCRRPVVTVNDTEVNLDEVTDRGYACIERTWSPGDVVELTLPMPVERIQAHPRLRHAVGKVALVRGPLVYCIEEVDNDPNVFDIRLPRDAEITVAPGPDSLEGMPVLRTTARRRTEDDWDDQLYRPVDDHDTQRAVDLTAVPYFAWGNRRPGEMTVWIEEDRS